MSKWADYLISCCIYDDNHIVKAGVHKDNVDSVDNKVIKKRRWIVNKLENDYTFCTIYRGQNDKWKKGANVNIIKVDQEKYLRTDSNKLKCDNLGELPEC